MHLHIPSVKHSSEFHKMRSRVCNCCEYRFKWAACKRNASVGSLRNVWLCIGYKIPGTY